MKDKIQIIFSGVGGQGLVMGGFILSEAASIHEGLQSAMVTTYGAESRGTFTKADVIISKKPIAFPEIIHPDVVIAMAQIAYDKYVLDLNEGDILIYDSNEVKETPSKVKQYGYPISDIAKEAGGLLSANMVAMGIMVKLTGVVNPESIIKTISDKFHTKESILQGNIQSFRKGMETVK